MALPRGQSPLRGVGLSVKEGRRAPSADIGPRRAEVGNAEIVSCFHEWIFLAGDIRLRAHAAHPFTKVVLDRPNQPCLASRAADSEDPPTENDPLGATTRVPGLGRELEGRRKLTDDPGRDTLLAHLAWKLSDRHEDIAVEALGFILRSEATRTTLRQVLRDGGADVGPIVRVATQVGDDDGTRPDLVGSDQRGDESVLIEAKFWAGLTDNQPKAYLDRLPRGKALLFVAPRSRVESLWIELCQRAEVDVPDPADHAAEVKSANVHDEKQLMLTSWAHLLERLELAGDEKANSAIRQLRGLARRVDESAFPPLRAEEFAPKLARRLLGLRRLVDDATTRGCDAGYMSTKDLRVVPRATGYGRYMSIEGVGAWFGLDFQSWARGSYPATPLWLSLEDWASRDLVDVRRAMKHRIRGSPCCFDEGNRVVVPIELLNAAEYEAVLKSVVEQLASIAKGFRRCWENEQHEEQSEGDDSPSVE